MSADPEFLLGQANNPLRLPTPGLLGPSGTTVPPITLIYCRSTIDSQYEILNNSNLNNVSGPVTNPNFPQWNLPTVVRHTTTATVMAYPITNVNPSGLVLSSAPGRWNYTTSNTSGGYAVSGNLYTVSAGEFTMSAVPGTALNTYTLNSGDTFDFPINKTFTWTEDIMPMPGPWPAGIAINTNVTVPAKTLLLWMAAAAKSGQAGASPFESFSWNWTALPG